MANEILVVERSRVVGSSTDLTVIGWTVSGAFFYPFTPRLETQGPTGPTVIVPTPSITLPEPWRVAFKLFTVPELKMLDDGDAVFALFNENLNEQQANNPSAAVAFLRETYVQKDPRDLYRYRHAFTGVRLGLT